MHINIEATARASLLKHNQLSLQCRIFQVMVTMPKENLNIEMTNDSMTPKYRFDDPFRKNKNKNRTQSYALETAFLDRWLQKE